MPPDVEIARLKRALELDPTLDFAHIYLGKAYLEKEFADKECLNLALEEFRTAMASPNTAVRDEATRLFEKTAARANR